jgi:parallel beta-helix repeat protein
VGPGGAGTENGINVTTAAHVSVRNGIIREWGGFGLESGSPGEFANLTFDHVGFNGGTGVTLFYAALSDCAVTNSGKSTGTGLDAGSDSSLMRCQFTANPGTGLLLEVSTASNVTATSNGVGIDANFDSTVMDSTASQNSGDGIQARSYSTISGDTASVNGGFGIDIFLGGGNTVSNNTATANFRDGIHVSSAGNRVSNNTASANGGNGITVSGPGNQVEDNTVNDSGATIGINVTDNGNTVSGNTVHGTSPIVAGSHGIDVSGKHNRVEANTTTSFDYDYYIGGGAGGKNLVIQNSAADAISGDNWNETNNDVGPRQTAATATDPFANIEY